MTRLASRVRSVALLGLVPLLIAGCSGDNPFSGGNVNTDPKAVFAKFMKLPDFDQATQQYQQMSVDIRTALSAGLPELASWTMAGEQSRAACGSDYPTMSNDGETGGLPDYVVYGNLPDDKYERALPIIGAAAQKYGFTPAPQRLHDAAGSHDAVFHNVADSSFIDFGTAKNTVLGVSIGCHLTAEAKKRGSPSQ
jgi:Lipoprotein confined to pathogenic Mycobacterium